MMTEASTEVCGTLLLKHSELYLVHVKTKKQLDAPNPPGTVSTYQFKKLGDAWMIYDCADSDEVADHVMERAERELDDVVTRKKYSDSQITLDELPSLTNEQE